MEFPALLMIIVAILPHVLGSNETNVEQSTPIVQLSSNMAPVKKVISRISIEFESWIKCFLLTHSLH